MYDRCPNRSLAIRRSEETPQLSFFFRWHAATIILADMNLCRPCGSIAPHLPNVFNAAGMMAGAPVLRAKDFEQRIQPLVDILEVFAKLPAAILTVFR